MRLGIVWRKVVCLPLPTLTRPAQSKPIHKHGTDAAAEATGPPDQEAMAQASPSPSRRKRPRPPFTQAAKSPAAAGAGAAAAAAAVRMDEAEEEDKENDEFGDELQHNVAPLKPLSSDEQQQQQEVSDDETVSELEPEREPGPKPEQQEHDNSWNEQEGTGGDLGGQVVEDDTGDGGGYRSIDNVMMWLRAPIIYIHTHSIDGLRACIKQKRHGRTGSSEKPSRRWAMAFTSRPCWSGCGRSSSCGA